MVRPIKLGVKFGVVFLVVWSLQGHQSKKSLQGQTINEYLGKYIWIHAINN